ncbi:LysR substrate-binding domain-containing protein [Roseicyclus sp. F158]|uniref:LysR substrate-binding domain-containing protein n=1 Tax=Tropicimonas omnivorans TaxID=3075590 RepID=A0ABU3DFU1_9RHOB|nr:LysR substrate-binding domain-containing protein [Roseicyclus sp. F158]MDT0682002.1 LysR substrate-binding domain-containing protein [Roseicyclus sp. F158]
MLNQRSLEVFRETMLYGSLIGAAQRLRISQPAVSRHIRELEARTGLTLFHRSGNSVTPTKQAFGLLAEVDRAFVGLRELEAQVKKIANGEIDSVTAAAMPVVATTLLPDVVAKLTTRFPDTSVELQSAHSNHIIPRVRGGLYTLGLVSLRQAVAGARAIWRSSFPYYCLLPPGDPLAAKDCITPEDLAGRHLIGYADTSVSGIMLDRVLSGITPQPIVRLRVHLSKSTWSLVENGCGIAIVDTFAAHVHRSRNGTVRKFATDTKFELTLVVPETAQGGPYMETFVETLEEISQVYKTDAFL